MSRMTSAFLLLVALPAAAQDWPHWRGPDRNGISRETGWQDRWPSSGPPLLWKGQVGTGYSSFAVAEGLAVTLGNEEDTDTIHAFDAETGKTRWTHAYPSPLGDRFFEGGPTSTPAIHEGRVYVQGRWGDLICLEAATGKPVWAVNVSKTAGARLPGWGFGGSPVVHGKLLLLNVGHGGAAVDKDTGAVVWKSADKDAGYSTPLIVKREGGLQCLLASGNSFYAVDPATGAESWRLRWVTSYGVNAADPIVDGDLVFLSSGYNHGGGVFRLGAEGPVPVWESKVMANQMNPCVLLDGHLYGVSGDSDKKPLFKCVEFATGTEKWSVPGLGAGGVCAADGRLILLSEAGDLIVAPASPRGFEPSARAAVLGGKSWTVPVLSRGRLYVRNADGDVACVDVRK
jgi:outer membrane protein assembly factor BamB